jgi:hypothetical protein
MDEGISDGPCTDPDTTSCYAGSDDRSKIPYSFNDTIKLQTDSNGPVYSFVSNQPVTGYSLYQQPPQGCPGKVERWHYTRFSFSTPDYQFPLIISQYLISCRSCAVNIYFDQNTFTCYCASLRPPFDYPQIDINGKTYSNVRKFEKKYDTTQFVLFSSQDGIIQIVSDGKTWKRVPE